MKRELSIGDQLEPKLIVCEFNKPFIINFDDLNLAPHLI